ncbi:AAA family ATPase [Phascolarctobacterium succinatutens]|uniref:AAA family ATPase n=1 Tax=Phascolarctobacterium succinatutens TaxID=626940 RepID=UPI0026EF2A06|nr:AAA family ATPase [Phascolarctobacterium succinatutens]
MIDKKAFSDALANYKKDFVAGWWADEKFKWEAVKCFQDNWNIDAEDFAEMLKRSLAKTYGLLASMNNFPRQMIEGFAEDAPDKVKIMFIALFDENKDVVERILNFKDQSEQLLKEYGYDAKNHYQNENSISTYLWLMYPDKYYIYKFGEIKSCAEVLQSSYKFKKGAYADNLRTFYSFYDELCANLQSDAEMKKLLADNLTEDCYPDKELRTLTIDFGFYIARKYSKADKENKWWPADVDYNPGLAVDNWMVLLQDESVFNASSLRIMKCFLEFGGAATCKQLSKKYGENANFYNAGSQALAKRIADKTKCTVITREDGKVMWWPILYVGRQVESEEEGVYVWKLRDELEQALKEIDLSKVELNAADVDDSVHDLEPIVNKKYGKEDFLAEVYMTGAKYDRLLNVLKRKKNIILQGAPGVGKTFAAKRLAYAMMGEKDKERVDFIQFHQNYSYEDFMMGYKPTENGGFEMQYGVFYRFCKKVENNSEKDYFFIIDEINRGNMSKIFGELLLLIEKDYRGTSSKLAYQNLNFSVPENLYIIGMMNTADRSLAMIDYALRRRFSFFDMEPGFDTEGFKEYQEKLASDKFNALIECIKELNNEIADDPSLGKGFCIGHSYFCGLQADECTQELLEGIVEYDILPMLSEYWFDNLTEKVAPWSEKLYGALND